MSPLPLAPPEPKIETDLSLLVPEMVLLSTALILKCANYGIGLRVTETRRLFKRQAWLYAANRTFEHPEATFARKRYEFGVQAGSSTNLVVLKNAWTAAARTRTNAPAGTSNHEKGEAIDVVPMEPWGVSARYDSPHWERIAQVGESLGLEWGGRWPKLHDRPHFQRGARP